MKKLYWMVLIQNKNILCWTKCWNSLMQPLNEEWRILQFFLYKKHLCKELGKFKNKELLRNHPGWNLNHKIKICSSIYQFKSYKYIDTELVFKEEKLCLLWICFNLQDIIFWFSLKQLDALNIKVFKRYLWNYKP